MRFRRLPIEIESPEERGYDSLRYNLAESSVPDATFDDLPLALKNLKLAYGDHRGYLPLRETLAETEGLDPQDILITAGAASALFIVATALLKPQTAVLVMHPNYSTNLETPRLLDCQLRHLNLDFDQGFALPLAAVATQLDKTVKLVSLTTPHNPTGKVLAPSLLQQVLALLDKTFAYLLVDETYRDLLFEATPPLAATLSPRVISVSSLSKAFGLPGLRIGWIACRDKALMETFLAAKEHIFICNSQVDEAIAYQVLSQKTTYLAPIREHVATNFAVTRAWMARQTQLEWVEPEGGVVGYPRIKTGSGVDPLRFYQILNQRYQTYVGPGHWFEMDARYMRIGFGWPDLEQLQQGLENISQALDEAAG